MGRDQDSLARESGYKSFKHYQAIKGVLTEKATEQEKFENSMETRGLMRSPREHAGEEVPQELYSIEDVGDALELLAKKHYNRIGVVYDHPSPSGAKEVAILKGRYYEGKTLGKLGKKFGISSSRVGQKRAKALQHLEHILTKERV